MAGVEKTVDEGKRHAMAFGQPIDGAAGFAREREGDFRIGLTACLFHDVGGENFRAVVDPARFLLFRTDARNETGRHRGGAERSRVALDDERFGAAFFRRQSRRQPTPAAADDHHGNGADERRLFRLQDAHASGYRAIPQTGGR
jgi:hypothetical protein